MISPSKTVHFLEQTRLGAHIWVLLCVLFWTPPTFVRKGLGFPVLCRNLNVINGTIIFIVVHVYANPRHSLEELQHRRQDPDLVDKRCAAVRMVSGSMTNQVASKSTFVSTKAGSNVQKVEGRISKMCTIYVYNQLYLFVPLPYQGLSRCTIGTQLTVDGSLSRISQQGSPLENP